MAFVLQKANRQFQYFGEAQVRVTTPQFLYNHLLPLYTQELERWIQLNPDPAGQGIGAGQLQNVVPITIGAVVLVMTSVVGMRSSVISAFQLPQGTDLCEAHLRQNLAKATLSMDFCRIHSVLRC